MDNQVSYLRAAPPTNDDRGSLKLLARFYCLFGGLIVIGGIGIGITNLNDLKAVGGAIVCFAIGSMLLSLGLSMSYHRYRIFSLVIASMTSLGFPIGTVLGIWTIVVLLRPGVKQIYRDHRQI
jgi:hypothetical protein